jgi:hypothetical protein
MKTKMLMLTGLLLSKGFAEEETAEGSGLDVVDSYVDIFTNMAQGKVGTFFIFLIIMMSGIMAWRNGNLTPLFWGLAAALLIGGAPKIAERLQTADSLF